MLPPAQAAPSPPRNTSFLTVTRGRSTENYIITYFWFKKYRVKGLAQPYESKTSSVQKRYKTFYFYISTPKYGTENQKNSDLKKQLKIERPL